MHGLASCLAYGIPQRHIHVRPQAVHSTSILSATRKCFPIGFEARCFQSYKHCAKPIPKLRYRACSAAAAVSQVRVALNAIRGRQPQQAAGDPTSHQLARIVDLQSRDFELHHIQARRDNLHLHSLVSDLGPHGNRCLNRT